MFLPLSTRMSEEGNSSGVKRQREDAGHEVAGSKDFDDVNPANPEAIFETSMGTITCEIFLNKVRKACTSAP